MGTGRLELETNVTQNGKDWHGVKAYWADLSDADLADLVAMAGEYKDTVEKHHGKGKGSGPLEATLTATITGATIPPGFQIGPHVYSGLSRHDVSKIEQAVQKIGDKLVKKGIAHAIKKEGLIER